MNTTKEHGNFYWIFIELETHNLINSFSMLKSDDVPMLYYVGL